MAPLLSLSLQLLTIATLTLRNQLLHDSIVTPHHELRSKYDFIVVGSGSSGAIVAARLAENQHVQVLLLEAGPPSGLVTDIPSQAASGQLYQSQYDWNYTITPQVVGLGFRNRVIQENRGFTIGGTSSFNSLIFNRGHRNTFDIWAQVFGAQGWSYEEVLPFFMKYERNNDPHIASNGFHGTSGPVEVSSWPHPPPIIQLHQKTMNGLGFDNVDINGVQQLGTMIMQAVITSKGRRASASNAYIDPNPYPHNLHILTESLVTKVLIKDKTAIGVEFVRHGKRYNVFAEKEVIVSAGAINSPQILMLSGIGPGHHLQSLGIPVVADLPTGDNYQNHPSINFNSFIKFKYYDMLEQGGQLTTQQLYDWFVNFWGPLTTHYRTVTYFNTRNNKEKDWPNGAFETGLYLMPTNVSDLREFAYENQHLWDAYNSQFLGRYYFFVHPILQRPRTTGRVRLLSKDPMKYPAIDANFLTDKRDMEDFIEIVKFSMFVYEESPISQLLEPLSPIPVCQPCHDTKYLYQCEPYIRCFIEQVTYSAYHPVGTCRMGDPKRKDVVVDPRLRVKGVRGLRVCDASIMPLLMNGNTNAGSLMIGEKCAHILKEEYKI